MREEEELSAKTNHQSKKARQMVKSVTFSRSTNRPGKGGSGGGRRPEESNGAALR